MKKVLLMTLFAIVLMPGAVFASNRIVQGQTGTKTVNEEIQEKVGELKTANSSLKVRLKADILTKTKTAAVKTIERAEDRYQKISSRVVEMQNISETEKSNVTFQINADLIKLSSLKNKVQSATTVEEVKAAMTELKTTLKTSKTAVQLKIDAIQATRLEGAVDKLTEISQKLSVKISGLKSNGSSVATLEIIEQSARVNLETAKTEILARKFPEAKRSILEARKDLIELSQKLKEEK